MKLRLLLAIQLVVSLLVLGIFTSLAGHMFWQEFGPLLPSNVSYGYVSVSVRDLLITYNAILLTLAALVFLLLYLLLSRIIIKPVKAVTVAMAAFAESRSFTPLTHISVSTYEIRALVKVFAEFADNVEQVHKRDMEMSLVKSDFISTAAHQLRTPLTGIRWALEALQKEQLNENQQVLIDSAVEKSKDLVTIVGTLLDISSIESGKHKYVFVQAALPPIVENVVSDFAIQAQTQQVELSVVPSPETLPMVRIDKDQIKWVLNNLIENAIRYTPAGGRVRVSFALFPERVQILVSDTGIGITTKDRNNIFERFYRADNAIAKENKGNGLGLYIARTIAKDHGGDLNFAGNSGGQGTTFTLSLPIQGQ